MLNTPPDAPVVLGLPIEDRHRSFAFYRDGLGLAPFGEPADDGVPEPLQFTLNEGIRLMLIPNEGFGWVAGGQPVAPRGTSECIVSITVETPAAVDDLMIGVGSAGAQIVTEAGQQPWGYAGTFADPDGHLWMVVSAGSFVAGR